MKNIDELCDINPDSSEGIENLGVQEQLEELRKAWRELFDALADALRLNQICEWLEDKLSKWGM